MPQDVTRKLGPSSSQSVTYESVGQAEDYSPILYNIDPTSTQILSRLPEGKEVTATDTMWMTKRLEPPSENAHLEYEEYKYNKVGSIEGLKNYVQFFQNTGLISDVQRKVKKIYNVPQGDAMSEAKTDAFTKQALDIEYALITNDKARMGSETVAPLMGGVPYFMDLDTLDVTVSSDTGVFTTTKEHNLKTGDFVYFIGKKMPAGMKAGAVYYVRLDTTNPKTKFTIYDKIQDAVRGGASATTQVKPTDAGTEVKIVKSNVKSLGGAAQYTLDDIDDVMAMAANRGGKPTDAYMSMENKRRFSKLVSAMATTNPQPKTRYGSEVADTYETDGGVVTAHSHRMYNSDRIDIYDFDYWELRYFEKPHEVNGLDKTGTYDKFVLETKLTLQASQPKASASIIGIKR